MKKKRALLIFAKLVLAAVLMFAVSSPTLAGHQFPGNIACDCGTPGCIPDPGECVSTNVATPSTGEPTSDATAEWGIVLLAVLFWLRLKA